MDRLAPAVKQLLGFDLTPAQIAAFRTYAAALAEWNEKFNLTAIKNPVDVEVKHFLDSLSCLLAFRIQHASRAFRIVDVGTGAGFPGIPLKIVCPEMKLTLVESVGKKVTFLEHVGNK